MGEVAPVQVRNQATGEVVTALRVSAEGQKAIRRGVFERMMPDTLRSVFEEEALCNADSWAFEETLTTIDTVLAVMRDQGILSLEEDPNHTLREVPA